MNIIHSQKYPDLLVSQARLDSCVDRAAQSIIHECLAGLRAVAFQRLFFFNVNRKVAYRSSQGYDFLGRSFLWHDRDDKCPFIIRENIFESVKFKTLLVNKKNKLPLGPTIILF